MKQLFLILMLAISAISGWSADEGKRYTDYPHKFPIAQHIILAADTTVSPATNVYFTVSELQRFLKTNLVQILVENGLLLRVDGSTNIVGLYSPPFIVNLTNSIGTVENGTTVASTTLGWTLAGNTITSQSFNQGIGAINTILRTLTDVGIYTSSRTYTLTISDGSSSANASTTITFSDKDYWGVSANASLSDADVIGLNSAFSSSRQMVKSLTCANQYMYFAYPASFGTATFLVNGLPNTAWTLTTRSFVNASGYASSYNIYRANNLFTGTVTVTVQ